MKSTIRTVILLSFMLTWGASFAQKPQDDPKYGDTPEARMKTLELMSLYGEYVKQKNYADALPFWRKVFMSQPKASKSIYTKGEKIMLGMIKANKSDKAKREAYLDTLIMVFNQRIENFGEKGYIEGKIGVNILKYRKSDFPTAYKHLSESVKIEKEKSSAATASTFMQTSVAMFKSGKHDGNQVVEDFGFTMDVLEPAVEKARIKAAKAKGSKKGPKYQRRFENLKTALKNVEVLFIKSGVANCAQLIGFFTPKFAETPEDLKLLKKITKYLDDQGCDDSELFAKAAEQLYKLEPSARSAYSLAKMFIKKENFEKAVFYYEEATTLDAKSEVPNEEFQAKCFYQKGMALMFQKKYQAARVSAKKAIEMNGSWGKPYILIARLYAASSSICKDKLDQNAVYWVAVDKLNKAKSVDPEVTDEAKKLISQYSKHYPNKETAFFHTITDGKPYTVGCWINESTKARF